MARLRDFFDAINVVMPGVAIPIFEPVLRYVIEDFCEKSRTWQVTLPMTLDPDGNVADVIDVAAANKDALEKLQVKLVDVLAIGIDGKPVDKSYYPWKRVARKGFTWTLRTVNSGELSVVVSVKPAMRCNEFDDDLLDNWRDAIACGVADRLQRQPNKDWSDIRAAMMNEERYTDLCNQALFEANNNRNGFAVAKSHFWMG